MDDIFVSHVKAGSMNYVSFLPVTRSRTEPGNSRSESISKHHQSSVHNYSSKLLKDILLTNIHSISGIRGNGILYYHVALTIKLKLYKYIRMVTLTYRMLSSPYNETSNNNFATLTINITQSVGL